MQSYCSHRRAWRGFRQCQGTRELGRVLLDLADGPVRMVHQRGELAEAKFDCGSDPRSLGADGGPVHLGHALHLDQEVRLLQRPLARGPRAQPRVAMKVILGQEPA